MVFKVLIIDDEPMVRKGMINVLDWAGLGCQVVGEAGNGKDGIEKIKLLRPDIILTDIHMPEVDGLQMIRETLLELENSKIIILTGFRDFDYIHEALKLGAFDYILKPSKLDQIVKVVKKAVMELKYTQQSEATHKIWQEKFEKALPILKEKLLRDIMISAQIIEDTVLEELETLNIKFSRYGVIVLELDPIVNLYNRHIIKFGVVNAFDELFSEQYRFEKVDLGNARVAFIVNAEQGDQEANVLFLIDELIKLCQKCFDLTLTAAVSSFDEIVENLPKKTQEALTAIDYSFYLGKGSIILYEDLKLTEYANIIELEPLAVQLMKAIKLGDVDETLRVVKEIEIITENNKNYHQVDLKSFTVRCIYDVYNFVLTDQQMNPNDYELDPVKLHQEIQESKNYKDLIRILITIASNVSKDSNKMKKKNINNIISDVVDYIDRNYESCITLNDLSEYVNVSTYYLSRMFKKEIGENFSEYLTDIRLKKAKQLLSQTHMKLYEIGEKVGIADPHYFSRLFKKTFGMTPTQYKESVNDKIID